MAATITPVVHGGRRGRWGVALALHVAGAAASAAAMGAVLGAVGAASGAPWGAVGPLLVAAAATAYAARAWFGLPVPLPERRTQVPEWWRTFFGPYVSSFLYGLGLGVGFLTYLGHGTLVAVAVAVLAGGDPALGAVALGAFGLARGLSVAVAVRARTAEDQHRLSERLDAVAASRVPAVVNGGALVVVAIAAARSVAGPAGRVAPSMPRAAALVLAAVFAWAAFAKAAAPGRWRSAVRRYGLGRTVEALAVPAVPTAEAAAAVLLVFGPPRVGGALPLVLLGTFSVAIVRARGVHGRQVPCGCFGRSRTRDARLLLVRNAALASAAVLVATGPVSPVFRLRPPTAGEGAALALVALAVVALAILTRAYAGLRRTTGPERPRPSP